MSSSYGFIAHLTLPLYFKIHFYYSVKILEDKNPHPEPLSGLPQLAKKLEVSLYKKAPSLEIYKYLMNRLKQRVQKIGVNMSQKARDRDRRRDSSGLKGNWQTDRDMFCQQDMIWHM